MKPQILEICLRKLQLFLNKQFSILCKKTEFVSQCVFLIMFNWFNFSIGGTYMINNCVVIKIHNFIMCDIDRIMSTKLYTLENHKNMKTSNNRLMSFSTFHTKLMDVIITSQTLKRAVLSVMRTIHSLFNTQRHFNQIY